MAIVLSLVPARSAPACCLGKLPPDLESPLNPFAEETADPAAALFCTDGNLERHGRAVGYDTTKVAARTLPPYRAHHLIAAPQRCALPARQAADCLRQTLAWRGSNRPWATQCEGCAANPQAHSMRCIGLDVAQRPVCYTSSFPADPTLKSSAPH